MKKLLISGLLLAASAAPAAADAIFAVDVFTIDNLTYDLERARLSKLVSAPIVVQRIDLISQFETEMSANLPPNEDEALKVATERLAKHSNAEIQSLYSQGLNSIQLAREIGVKKVPAVVFNRKWIVYGLDPLRAYQIFEERNETGTLEAKN